MIQAFFPENFFLFTMNIDSEEEKNIETNIYLENQDQDIKQEISKTSDTENSIGIEVSLNDEEQIDTNKEVGEKEVLQTEEDKKHRELKQELEKEKTAQKVETKEMACQTDCQQQENLLPEEQKLIKKTSDLDNSTFFIFVSVFCIFKLCFSVTFFLFVSEQDQEGIFFPYSENFVGARWYISLKIYSVFAKQKSFLFRVIVLIMICLLGYSQLSLWLQTNDEEANVKETYRNTIIYFNMIYLILVLFCGFFWYVSDSFNDTQKFKFTSIDLTYKDLLQFISLGFSLFSLFVLLYVLYCSVLYCIEFNKSSIEQRTKQEEVLFYLLIFFIIISCLNCFTRLFFILKINKWSKNNPQSSQSE